MCRIKKTPRITSPRTSWSWSSYQIAAAERIMNRIAMSTNHKQLGTLEAGGYIWHTTGSGKTLTSFKTAQLATRLELRSKKELIERFINTLNVHSDVDIGWREFTDKSKGEDLENIIEQENLKPEETRKFIANAFRDGEIKSTGTGFASILPPVSMFDKNNIHQP